MLETLTLDRFVPLVGSHFALRVDEALELPARLIAAQATAGQPFRGRTSFALTFEGPLEPQLPQRIYGLFHPALDAVDIFLVPVARHAGGMQYEAVFA